MALLYALNMKVQKRLKVWRQDSKDRSDRYHQYSQALRFKNPCERMIALFSGSPPPCSVSCYFTHGQWASFGFKSPCERMIALFRALLLLAVVAAISHMASSQAQNFTSL